MTTSILLLLVGFIALFLGGEFLVRGAVGMAARLRISTLVIGSTVVAFGTSMPELTVSLSAVIQGSSDISVGNVVGSNIANIALVLGITILIFPLKIGRGTMRFEWPMVMLASAVLLLLTLDHNLSRWDGAILLALLAFYLYKNLQSARESRRENQAPLPGMNMSLWRGIVLILVGTAALILGSQWLVEGAVKIARTYHVSERVIAISLVAFGTSLPELITSVMAAVRRHHDISAGNLLGSNIFNICSILGITSVFHPMDVQAATLDTDIVWMVIIAFSLLPFFLLSPQLKRWQGVLLFLAYCWYILSELI